MSEQPLNEHAIHEEENKLIAQRKEKLAVVREQGNAFPNDFRRDNYCADLQKTYADKTKDRLTLPWRPGIGERPAVLAELGARLRSGLN